MYAPIANKPVFACGRAERSIKGCFRFGRLSAQKRKQLLIERSALPQAKTGFLAASA